MTNHERVLFIFVVCQDYLLDTNKGDKDGPTYVVDVITTGFQILDSLASRLWITWITKQLLIRL